MAILVTDLKINDVVSLTLYGLVNGSATVTGTIVSVVSSQGLPPGNNAGVNHTNIYRDLPQTVKDVTLDDYTSYQYMGIKLANGGIIYIGMPWVIQGSITITVVRTAIITIADFRDADAVAVSNLLKANGYTVSSTSIS